MMAEEECIGMIVLPADAIYIQNSWLPVLWQYSAKPWTEKAKDWTNRLPQRLQYYDRRTATGRSNVAYASNFDS